MDINAFKEGYTSVVQNSYGLISTPSRGNSASWKDPILSGILKF
jgi:hypothetical protein